MNIRDYWKTAADMGARAMKIAAKRWAEQQDGGGYTTDECVGVWLEAAAEDAKDNGLALTIPIDDLIAAAEAAGFAVTPGDSDGEG